MGLSSESERILYLAKFMRVITRSHTICLKKNHYLDMELKCLDCIKEENFVANDACTTHPHNFLCSNAL